MRSIAIINQKGGVGKTTTAVNLSAALASAGQRVCVIDLDPQAHATLHFGVSGEQANPSLYDLLVHGRPWSEAVQRIENRLSLIPSHIDLAAAEVELANVADRERILQRHLQGVHDYDYVVIDCPPSLGILTLNALAAVREVILPLQPHFLALHGLSKLLGTIDVVATRLNPDLRLAGVVFCMYESGTRLAGEVARDVESFLSGVKESQTSWYGAKAFTTRIRRNIRLAEAPSFGRSIHEYAPTSAGAQDYQALATEVESMDRSNVLFRQAA